MKRLIPRNLQSIEIRSHIDVMFRSVSPPETPVILVKTEIQRGFSGTVGQVAR